MIGWTNSRKIDLVWNGLNTKEYVCGVDTNGIIHRLPTSARWEEKISSVNLSGLSPSMQDDGCIFIVSNKLQMPWSKWQHYLDGGTICELCSNIPLISYIIPISESLLTLYYPNCPKIPRVRGSWIKLAALTEYSTIIFD